MTDSLPAVSLQTAGPDDVHDIAELWCEAFPGRRTIADRVHVLETGGRYGGLDTVVVARDRERLVAACKCYRMEERILGVAVPMLGLAAVAMRSRPVGISPARRSGSVTGSVIRVRPDTGPLGPSTSRHAASPGDRCCASSTCPER